MVTTLVVLLVRWIRRTRRGRGAAARASVLVALVALAGCHVGGGPTLGYRRGAVTAGWEAGVGVGADAVVRADVGQSWRDGEPFTYGALGVVATDGFSGYGEMRGGWATLGGGGGDGGPSMVAGAGGYLGAANETTNADRGGEYWVYSMVVGVRWIANAVEVFATPRVDWATMPAW